MTSRNIKHGGSGEAKLINSAVDGFAKAMKARMQDKRRKGWIGWHEAAAYPVINTRLLINAASASVKEDKQSCVDAANLAMMIWLKEKTQ